jgi:hypothetical protein
MDNVTGWLLDVTIEENVVTLWIKTLYGRVLRLVDGYRPCFYVIPTNAHTGAELFHSLSQQPKIRIE